MPRPKRRPADPVGGVRAALIMRRERLVAELSGVATEVYDFTEQVGRLGAEIEDLTAGRPVVVPRAELPREFVALHPGVWSFTVEGEQVSAVVL